MNFSDVWQCLIAEWKIKVLGGGIVTAMFWFGYFFIGQTHTFPVFQMPITAIDRLIPFQPAAAFFYLSQFFTMPLVLWLMVSRRQIMSCCFGLALLIGVSFAVFFIWPTSITRPETILGQHPLYDLIASHDLPRNACPSLHAGFGVFIAGYACEVFRGWPFRRCLVGAVWLWTGAVLISTLLVKQHVFLDLVAGGILGTTSWLLTRPKINVVEVRA
jgi:membrane-associated phospholipid phosphatase